MLLRAGQHAPDVLVTRFLRNETKLTNLAEVFFGIKTHAMHGNIAWLATTLHSTALGCRAS